MKTLTRCSAVLAIAAAGFLAGCSNSSKSPDLSQKLRSALDQAGLKKISVRQDHDKGVVTLGGQVALDSEKADAESIASSVANGQVVSNQIAVLPAGAEGQAKTVNSDLDKGIEQNLDAAFIQGKLHDRVKFAVKSQVETLTGEVDSQAMRQQAGRIATSIPYVQQVVNELQVKNQKATSSE